MAYIGIVLFCAYSISFIFVISPAIFILSILKIVFICTVHSQILSRDFVVYSNLIFNRLKRYIFYFY